MRRRWRRMCALFAAGVLLCGCSAQKETAELQIEKNQGTKTEKKQESLGGTVGIAFADQDDKTRKTEAEKIKKELEAREYQVELVYAGNDGKRQEEQIDQMIKEKVSCLVICPVDSGNLKDSLKKAKKQGITVISYDKLIGNTEDLSYYVGFDYNDIGKKAAEYFVKEKKLDSAKKEKKSYTIEFFMGALDDMNERIQMDAMMKVLNTYFDQGVLQCKSLRTIYEDVSIAKASGEIAEKTCDNIMKANYMDKPVDLIYVGNDDMTGNITDALKEQSGFEKEWPMVAGCGSNEAVFERLKNGTQALSLYQLREELPQMCVDVVHKSIQGEEIKDSDKVNNGTAEIAAVFGNTKHADGSNYEQVQKEAGIS